jgi:hypothetical protein
MVSLNNILRIRKPTPHNQIMEDSLSMRRRQQRQHRRLRKRDLWECCRARLAVLLQNCREEQAVLFSEPVLASLLVGF